MADETPKAIAEQSAQLTKALASAEEKSTKGFSSVVNGLKKVTKTQQETTRQLMSAEERAKADAKAAEQSRIRSEAAIKGHETRLANESQDTAQDTAQESQSTEKESTGYLSKITKFMGMDRLRGAAEAEDSDKAEASDKKQNTFLGKIAGGIGNIFGKVKDQAKETGGDIMGMLKKFAFGAFAVAILAFLRSPYFDKFLKVIKEQLVPALTTLIDDYIIPVAKVFWDNIVKAWENIKELFSGLKESFALFG